MTCWETFKGIKTNLFLRALLAAGWLFALATVLQGSEVRLLDVIHRAFLPFACLGFALLLRPVYTPRGGWRWFGGVVAGSIGILGILALLAFDFALSSYFVLLSLCALSFGIREVILVSLKEPLPSAISGLFFSFNLVALSGVYSLFSDEEFLLLFQAILLFAFWLILFSWIDSKRCISWESGMNLPLMSTRAVLACAIVVSSSIAFVALSTYRQSFGGGNSASMHSASSSVPFICNQARLLPPEATQDDFQVDGASVFAQLVHLVQLNPDKQAPEYGFLAIATDDYQYANKFKQALLSEANAKLFVGPYGSVKYDQHRAALRAYYFTLVKQKFPHLFSAVEQRQLYEWFHQINRSAHSIEWVDFLYSIPYSRLPSAPYLNQEIGAGLLAVLEYGDLSAPELKRVNGAYLARESKGWRVGFRVPDDAFIYQRDWITNAYFQHLYLAGSRRENMLMSFRWIIVQLPPDGGYLSYNLPVQYRFSMAPITYLGYRLTGDPHMLWIAAQGLKHALRDRIPIFAQPGAEVKVDGVGQRPDFGSCLIYSQMGLSSEISNLLPDKVVLRSGWFDGSPFLLMNLRFGGWHQYKATATVSHVQYRRPLLADFVASSMHGLLPRGRAQHRDKRIPREDLNGVSIEQIGLPRLLLALTGLGSPWAQDPPRFVRVSEFSSNKHYDTVSVEMDWHGWTLRRQITLHHSAHQIVVVDRLISSPLASQSALLSWHMQSGTQLLDKPAQRSASFRLAYSCGILSVESDSPPLAIRTITRESTSGRVLTVRHELRANSVVTTYLKFNQEDCA